LVRFFYANLRIILFNTGRRKAGRHAFFFYQKNFCNLRCKFTGGNLCDTSYTSWFPDDKTNLGEVEIVKVVKEYEKIMCKDVVITGGEPTMYAEELESLMVQLKEKKSKCNYYS
jgi:organic radical activating enzyme